MTPKRTQNTAPGALSNDAKGVDKLSRQGILGQ